MKKRDQNMSDSKGQSDEGANALLRLLPMNELNDAYRRAKADETEKGQHAAKVIGREIIRRRFATTNTATLGIAVG